MEIGVSFAAAVGNLRSGATEIEERLITDLLAAREAWNRKGLIDGAGLLEDRTVMANLHQLASVIREAGDLDDLQRRLVERRKVLRRLDTLLAAAGAPLVISHGSVVTISRSSAVEAVLIGAAERRWSGTVVVLDGTVSGCGPDQARRLADRGLEVRSLPDGALLDGLAGLEDPLVLVGADAVGPRRIVNAQGTRLLLEIARGRGFPALVVADSGKNAPEDLIDRLVTGTRRHEESGPGRSWPVFEVVPRELLTGRIDEGTGSAAAL